MSGEPIERSGIANVTSSAPVDDHLPEKKLIAGLIPHWGPVVAQYVQDRHDREQRRLEALAEGLADRGVSPEEVLVAATSDPTRAALIDAAFAAAQRSTWPIKARVLGRALADGHLASDDAQLDEASVRLTTVAQLEAVDVRVLEVLQKIMTDRLEVPEVERTSNGIGKGISVMYLSKYAGGLSQPVLTHIVARLNSLGLLTTLGVSYQGMSAGWAPSDYGVSILQYLYAAAEDDPNPTV